MAILARRKLLQRFQKPRGGDRFNFNGAAVWRLGRGLRYVIYMIKYIVSGHWWPVCKTGAAGPCCRGSETYGTRVGLPIKFSLWHQFGHFSANKSSASVISHYDM